MGNPRGRFLDRLAGRLTYANVVATLALFIALGGTATAISEINGKQIRNHSIAGSKLIDHTLGATQINVGKLGTVPRATNATDATNSSELGGVAARPAWQALTLENGCTPVPGYNPPAYLVDAFGFVHLEGAIEGCQAGEMFTLPASASPAEEVNLPVHDWNSDVYDSQLFISAVGTVDLYTQEDSFPTVSLEGITFRAGS